ncbi:hypothetical protein CA2559_08401 [Croceibacter atlanticus HTCC2559]|uniref:Glyoxalase n=2 Tax=Croceibacter TaxID=216431 RepID=A3UBN8_CROAH|nr:hypothetical protein CA2559_08401 [Croceibacter atlanticus HTCC2559]
MYGFSCIRIYRFHKLFFIKLQNAYGSPTAISSSLTQSVYNTLKTKVTTYKIVFKVSLNLIENDLIMNDRDREIKALRPKIVTATVTASTSSGEKFQNETIRPILKLQNDLLIEVFRNYIRKHKNLFYKLNAEKRFAYIENAIQKDIKFRNSLKGILIGQFTKLEYLTYINDSSALNKRMMNLTTERLQSQIQLFETLEVA